MEKTIARKFAFPNPTLNRLAPGSAIRGKLSAPTGNIEQTKTDVFANICLTAWFKDNLAKTRVIKAT